jgi:hypothetical protein
VDGLDVELVLAGHGRPVRDATALIEANRAEIRRRLEAVRAAASDGARTPFEIVPAVVGADAPEQMRVSWGLSEVLCYLRHLEALGQPVQLA